MTVISTTEAVEGVAAWLDVQGLGDYRPGGVYAEGDRAVTLRRLPAHPDTAVSVTAYGVDDPAPDLTDSVVMLQLRFRTPAGDMTSVDDWADEVADRLHNGRMIYLDSGLVVQRARRVIAAPFGPDENGRPERADSYRLLFMLPQ